MPTRIYQRIWCKKCKEFELHSRKGEELICESCGTAYTDVYLKDIPKEHLIEQRKRYIGSQQEKFGNIYSKMIFPRQSVFEQFASMMDEPGSDVEIIESDAGQKLIDKAKKEEREKRWEEQRIQREKDLELQKKYQHLGRNDKCLCGSNKKFKNCCWSKIQNIR